MTAPPTPPIVSSKTLPRLICIEYPAIVQNPDRAIETLGGLQGIAKAVSSNKRLELSFRPNDVFSKHVYGDRNNSTKYLIRVKRRRQNLSDTPSGSNSSPIRSLEDGWIYSVEIVGIIDVSYKFRTMCDFQFVPMWRQPDNTYASLTDKLIPQRLETTDWLRENSSELYLPPTIFSRFDKPIRYSYREEPRPRDKDANTDLGHDVVAFKRKRVQGLSIFIYFRDEAPLAASPEATQHIQKYLITTNSQEAEIKLRELFEQRPVWSRNALRFYSKVNLERLKTLLPSFGYCFANGPWRRLWVRFGYDPRRDNGGRMYQLIDFRAPRDNEVIRTKKDLRYSVNLTKLTVAKDDSQATDDIEESSVVFKSGVLPSQRNTLYQLCDLHVPQIEQMLQDTSQVETICSEDYGWVSSIFLEKCRTIMKQEMQKLDNRGQEQDKEMDG